MDLFAVWIEQHILVPDLKVGVPLHFRYYSR
jgi:hypothetical protein